ncbi:MAG: Ig-like domain-containing protein, partial [Vicinamibacterales bacterium]
MNKTLVLGSVLAIMLSLLGPTVSAAVTSRVSATRGVATQQVSDPVVIPLSLTSETPSVTLTSPSTGAVFASGARVTIAATTVSSEFNRITAVDFYVGDRFIGREEDPPYT